MNTQNPNKNPNMVLSLKKHGITHCRSAAKLLFAKADDQLCLLHFACGEQFWYSYPLKKFQQLVSSTGLFARVHRSYLISLGAVVGYAYRKAHLSNGTIIPLSAAGYQLVKEYINSLPA
jgi:DNA-binding LytR/AlgR family response regulator